MSKLREAAQQVLEWLDQESWPGFDEWVQEGRAIRASLRAALAEPTCKDDLQVEPVAYRYWSTKWHSWEYSDAPPVFPAVPAGTKVEPLYTHPAPQRQPLTDEEIVDIWADVSIGYDDEINIIELARAIERAHGIGGQDEVQS